MASTTARTSHLVSNLVLGSDADGVDFTVYGDTTGHYLKYDASANKLQLIGSGAEIDIDAALDIDDTLTVGEDGTGYDVTFYGDTAGTYMRWDEDVDSLLIPGTAGKFSLGTFSSSATCKYTPGATGSRRRRAWWARS